MVGGGGGPWRGAKLTDNKQQIFSWPSVFVTMDAPAKTMDAAAVSDPQDEFQTAKLERRPATLHDARNEWSVREAATMDAVNAAG